MHLKTSILGIPILLFIACSIPGNKKTEHIFKSICTTYQLEECYLKQSSSFDSRRKTRDTIIFEFKTSGNHDLMSEQKLLSSVALTSIEKLESEHSLNDDYLKVRLKNGKEVSSFGLDKELYDKLQIYKNIGIDCYRKLSLGNAYENIDTSFVFADSNHVLVKQLESCGSANFWKIDGLWLGSSEENNFDWLRMHLSCVREKRWEEHTFGFRLDNSKVILYSVTSPFTDGCKQSKTSI